MNRQQLILLFSAIALTAGLYIFGPTAGARKPPVKAALDNGPHNAGDFVIETFLTETRKGLTPARQQYLLELENRVKRGDVNNQQLHVFHQQAAFWKDSAANPVAYFYYLSRASALDKSEKTLTFAAQSILGYLPYAEQANQRVWLSNQCRSLFEQALQINPQNDSSVVGLGACYFYGAAKDGDNNPWPGF